MEKSLYRLIILLGVWGNIQASYAARPGGLDKETRTAVEYILSLEVVRDREGQVLRPGSTPKKSPRVLGRFLERHASQSKLVGSLERINAKMSKTKLEGIEGLSQRVELAVLCLEGPKTEKYPDRKDEFQDLTSKIREKFLQEKGQPKAEPPQGGGVGRSPGAGHCCPVLNSPQLDQGTPTIPEGVESDTSNSSSDEESIEEEARDRLEAMPSNPRDEYWEKIRNLEVKRNQDGDLHRVVSPKIRFRNLSSAELVALLRQAPEQEPCPEDLIEKLRFMRNELNRKVGKGNSDDSLVDLRKSLDEKYFPDLLQAPQPAPEAPAVPAVTPHLPLTTPQAVTESDDSLVDPEDARQKYYIMAVVAGALLMDWAVRRDKSIVGSSIRAVKRLWSYLRGVKKQDEEVFDSAVDQAKELLAQEGIILEEG